MNRSIIILSATLVLLACVYSFFAWKNYELRVAQDKATTSSRIREQQAEYVACVEKGVDPQIEELRGLVFKNRLAGEYKTDEEYFGALDGVNDMYKRLSENKCGYLKPVK